MEKRDKERRVYPKEFKAEAVALGREARETGKPGCGAYYRWVKYGVPDRRYE